LAEEHPALLAAQVIAGGELGNVAPYGEHKVAGRTLGGGAGERQGR
jgi:hypothetical protein